jgi:hypothetical protein
MAEPILDKLIEQLTGLIDKATLALQSAPTTTLAWQSAVEILIARYSLAGLYAGYENTQAPAEAVEAVARDVEVQLKFLDRFALEIQAAPEWQAGWNARAASYARSIQTPYWRGKTKMLPLPALPGDGGSSCLYNCNCIWDIKQLEGEGNYDCYWRLTASDNICQTCAARATLWNPYKIRDGSVVL